MRRWLLRSLLFWAITLPLFYLLALPWLIGMLQTKTREETYAQCQGQLLQNGMVGQPHSSLATADAETYCHCVSDGITITQADVITLAQHKQPERIENELKPVVEACNAKLETMLGDTMRKANGITITAPEAPGTETVTFN